ncbi:MAG: hypothetical protein RMK19_07390 [Bacteroidia bacterium]|nr:hypothetical protein [Bacteroidia bacterium]MDW8015818.1 hypothetical protein [Bacteroidia bacterium]
MRIIVFLAVMTGMAWAQDLLLRRTARIKRPTLPAFANQVEGKVIDGKTGEPLPGVLVRTRNKGIYTSEKGSFSLPFSEPETLTIFLAEYRLLKVFVNRPQAGLVFRLFPLEVETEPVQIIADVEKETEAGVFVERMRSLEIAELYSQEQIAKRSTDFYAPNVLRRLPGVSLLSGRFVSIRGLSERYNAFAFGGAYPSWVSYDGSFAEADQLLSNLLGKVEVRKFWTPELLGHFGGGLIDFQLPSGGGEGLQIAYTTEVDFQAVGRAFPRFRSPIQAPVPKDFPSPAQVQASENGGQPLPENFAYGRQVKRYTVPDTMRWSLPGGFLSVAYDKSRERWRLAIRSAFIQRFLHSSILFGDGYFEEQGEQWIFIPTYRDESPNPITWNIRSGGLSWSFSYQPSAAHTLSVEGIGITTGLQRISLEEAGYINPRIALEPSLSYYPTFLLQRQSLLLVRPTWRFSGFRGWQSALQLGGLFQTQEIPQAGAMNYLQYPGQADFSYELELYEDYEIYAQVWSSQVRAQQGYVHPWVEKRWEGGGGWLQWRLGGWYSQEMQGLRGRQLGFMPDTAGGAPNVLDPTVYSLNFIREVYAPAHIRPGGWYLIDRTEDFHRHRGRTTLAAAYTWLRGSWNEQWEALLGLRYELWQRRLWHIPIATEQEAFLRGFQDQHLLPAVLVKYRFAEQHTLRLGGNITLIRPPFPSHIPLRYFDFLLAYYWRGDTSLRTGRSFNAELRYEWLRDKDNLIALGLFYKRLANLPEIYLVPASYTAVFTYSNRQRRWGEIMGLEVEARRTLWEGGKARLWSYLTLTMSESALEQSVWQKLGRLEGRLQGHAPVVGNLGLIYQRPQWEAAIFANYTHDQIWAMGFDPYIYPHLVEEKRLLGEAQVSYRIGARWELRLAIGDFINMPYRRTQRVGNQDIYRSGRDATPLWERWAYRGYITLRYRVY